MDAATVQSNQQNFVIARTNEANTFIDRLNALASINAAEITGLPSPNFVTNIAGADPISTRSFLQLLRPGTFIVPPVSSAQPSFVAPEIDAPGDIAVPDFSKVSPVLNLPSAPSSALPAVPSAPTINQPALPSAPVVSLPVAPTIAQLTLPDPPAIALPGFNSTLPIDDLVAPTGAFDFAEAPYQSALLDATTAKLLDNLANGGYGIETQDEAALWNRARDREMENSLQAIELLYTTGAARGFPFLPPGLPVAVQVAQQDLTDKMSGISRDIAIKRGDLYVENRKFTIQEARELESVLISYYMSQMERVLNAQRATLEFSINLFTALVSRYNARLTAYQASAQVFEAQVRAALAQTEIYRTQMEGKRIESEIQRDAVEVYRAQLSGVEALVNIYKVEMEAAQVQAGIERTKIDAFRALIDAYAAQVQAKTAEFGMYEAQVRGETAKVNAFQAEVQAYAGQVSAAETKARIENLKVDAAAKSATIKLETYKTDVERFKADLDSQLRVIAAQTSAYTAQIQGYNADVAALSESYRLSQAASSLEYQNLAKQADIAIENAKLNFASLSKLYDIKLGASGIAGTYYANLIGGANNAITTIAALNSST